MEDNVELVDVVLALEDGAAAEELGEDAADAPDVDFLVAEGELVRVERERGRWERTGGGVVGEGEHDLEGGVSQEAVGIASGKGTNLWGAVPPRRNIPTQGNTESARLETASSVQRPPRVARRPSKTLRGRKRATHSVMKPACPAPAKSGSISNPLASPKSQILSSQSALTRRFPGLRSRWSTRAEWMYCSPCPGSQPPGS